MYVFNYEFSLESNHIVTISCEKGNIISSYFNNVSCVVENSILSTHNIVINLNITLTHI